MKCSPSSRRLDFKARRSPRSLAMPAPPTPHLPRSLLTPRGERQTGTGTNHSGGSDRKFYGERPTLRREEGLGVRRRASAAARRPAFCSRGSRRDPQRKPGSGDCEDELAAVPSGPTDRFRRPRSSTTICFSKSEIHHLILPLPGFAVPIVHAPLYLLDAGGSNVKPYTPAAWVQVPTAIGRRHRRSNSISKYRNISAPGADRV